MTVVRAISREESNVALRSVSHHKLGDLFDEATKDDFYGIVGIEATVENGRITTVRIRKEMTHK